MRLLSLMAATFIVNSEAGGPAAVPPVEAALPGTPPRHLRLLDAPDLGPRSAPTGSFTVLSPDLDGWEDPGNQDADLPANADLQAAFDQAQVLDPALFQTNPNPFTTRPRGSFVRRGGCSGRSHRHP